MIQINPLIALLSSVLSVSIFLAASFENSIWTFQTEQDIEEFQILGEKAYFRSAQGLSDLESTS